MTLTTKGVFLLTTRREGRSLSIIGAPHYSTNTHSCTQPTLQNLRVAPSVLLLGPPEIHHKSQASQPTKYLLNNSNKKENQYKAPPLPPPPPPYKGLTENRSPTFQSSGNPCLDFFFHVVPDTPVETLTRRLELAWEHDALKALKLICHLRGVRGTGKSDKLGFYKAALWLHENHPKTLAHNVQAIQEFGYYKDLPEILSRLLQGTKKRKRNYGNEQLKAGDPDGTTRGLWNQLAKDPSTGCVYYYNEKTGKSQWLSPLVAVTLPESTLSIPLPPDWEEVTHEDTGKKYYFNMKTRQLKTINCLGCGYYCEKEWGYCTNCTREQGLKLGVPRETRLAAEKKKVELQRKRASELRMEKELEEGRKALEKYYNDPDFRFLHDQVSQLFADQLISDMKFLKSGELFKISLASKWCPNVCSSYDKTTLLCESIARRVFPRDSYPEYQYQGIEEAHYAYRVRDRLRKEYLVPRHKIKEIPEIYITSNRWNFLPYKYVPSVAMKKYKELFLKHDKQRFSEYLGDVKSGKAKIAAGALLPHEIIKQLNKNKEDGDHEVAELQWKRMVDDLSAKGKMKNCIAVCDVSGSMHGRPMEVCVALGLLLSELSEDPWKGKVITFSSDPEMHQIIGEDLRSKTRFIKNMAWGYNTNLQKVFDQILQVAVSGNLSKDKMINKVFVFSDMEFDEAREHLYENSSEECENWNTDYPNSSKECENWNTDYEEIERKFREKGFRVPEIVFWNLRDSTSTPVASNKKGVALVSGFSKNLMKVFLEEKELPDPESVMEAALSGPEYEQLVVVD